MEATQQKHIADYDKLVRRERKTRVGYEVYIGHTYHAAFTLDAAEELPHKEYNKLMRTTH